MYDIENKAESYKENSHVTTGMVVIKIMLSFFFLAHQQHSEFVTSRTKLLLLVALGLFHMGAYHMRCIARAHF